MFHPAPHEPARHAEFNMHAPLARAACRCATCNQQIAKWSKRWPLQEAASSENHLRIESVAGDA